MRRYTAVIAIALVLSLLSQSARAQYPKLPPTNLGLSNMQDGKPPGTGWFFQQYIQSYQTQSNRGPEGNDAGGAKINSILSLSQLIWISKIKVAGGNLGFTVFPPDQPFGYGWVRDGPVHQSESMGRHHRRTIHPVVQQAFVRHAPGSPL
jgi:hypothetical protein